MEIQQKSTVDLKLKPTIDCCKYYYKRTCNSRVAGLGVPFPNLSTGPDKILFGKVPLTIKGPWYVPML